MSIDRTTVQATILAVGIAAGGLLAGNGLVRAKAADRYVSVKGVSEREVRAQPTRRLDLTARANRFIQGWRFEQDDAISGSHHPSDHAPSNDFLHPRLHVPLRQWRACPSTIPGTEPCRRLARHVHLPRAAVSLQ